MSRGPRAARLAPGAVFARAIRAAIFALSIPAVLAGAGCRGRGGPVAGAAAGGGVATGGAPALPRRAVARPGAAFSHPLLAGATTEVTQEDCSRPALTAVVARALAIEAKADSAGAAGTRSKRAGEGCPSAAAEETEKIVRGELLTRVGGCVARDGPLDPQWDMVNSAVLSLGVCFDCRRVRDEQVTQCRRARDVLLRAAQLPR